MAYGNCNRKMLFNSYLVEFQCQCPGAAVWIGLLMNNDSAGSATWPSFPGRHDRFTFRLDTLLKDYNND